MQDDEEPPPSTCRFCVIHEYGFYALMVFGMTLLVTLILCYFRELSAYCRGRYKLKQPAVPHDGRSEQSLSLKTLQPSPQSMPQQKSSQPMNLGFKPFSQAALITPRQMAEPAQPQIQTFGTLLNRSPQSPLKSQAIMPGRPRSPQLTIIDMPAMRSTPIRSPTSPMIANQQRQDQFLTKPMSPPVPMISQQIDPYKLPKELTPLAKHESTGSDYFRQMMKGKKRVASISQYLNKRRKKSPLKPRKLAKKDSDPKKHYHGDKKRKSPTYL